MKLVIFGCPGSGKGSLAEMLARHLRIVHISCGEIFRQSVKTGIPLGKSVEEYIKVGNLVPDEITANVIRERLLQPDCKKGFILDGFPRTLCQAQSLDDITDVDYVIQILASCETVIARLASRYICKKCQIIHNSRWDDTTKCRVCAGQLYQRDDDKACIIQKRLDDYHARFAPIMRHFESKGRKILTIGSKLCDTPEGQFAKFKELYGELF